MSRTASSLERILTGSLTGVALVLLAWFRPAEDVVLCPFRRLTGMLCPLCGITRGVSDVLHGEWLAAAGHHALSPLAVIVMVSMLVLSLLGRTFPNRLWIYLLVTFVVFGAARIALQASLA